MTALLCTRYGAPRDVLGIGDAPKPGAGPGQVLVAVKAASLNFPDLLMVRGDYQVKPPLPFSPGTEFAGTVEAVGEGVTRFAPGDAVIGFGGHGGLAQFCVKDEGNVIALPPGMDAETGAAFVVTYGTSLHALRTCARLQAGETLLVLGASGGVGLAALEIGKAMGARVIAAASTGEKLALCREKGADETINYATESLRDRLKALTAGKGVDVVYDPVGGPYSEPALRETAWRGRYLVVGFAFGEIPKVALNLALLQERAILGVYWGRSVIQHPEEHRANMALLGAWFADGRIAPHVTERVDLHEVADAMERLGSRTVTGKIVVRV
jgi:NADPH2:quinone reductase